jgi:hypothetical protein
MRIYIISNDGITLCREPTAPVNEAKSSSLLVRNCTPPRLAASGCWHYGTLCPVSKSAERSATATP